jgi:hypothetical protein
VIPVRSAFLGATEGGDSAEVDAISDMAVWAGSSRFGVSGSAGTDLVSLAHLTWHIVVRRTSRPFFFFNETFCDEPVS